METTGVSSFRGATMGTTYEVTLQPGSDAGGIQPEIDRLLDEINASLSTYLSDSIISTINASRDTDTPIRVDEHFDAVFGKALDIHLDTGGAFNPAIAPLVNAWGFGPSGPREEPDDAQIRHLLETARMDAFDRTADGIRKRISESALDFSAIAKGYAVDRVAAALDGAGMTSYFVEIGGEVRTRGMHPDRRPWRIGIERPTADATDSATLQRVVALTDGALATSGSYRNYAVINGRRMTHILDPSTGYPETTSLLSVSVLARDAMTADAYATALMVMGLDEGLRFVESRPDLEAYFIADGEGAFIERESTGFPAP
jgi:thiamine biosynthesis lipoprotein